MDFDSRKKIKVFIDADVISLDHFSGIGHYTASLLKAVDTLLEKPEYSNFSITLGVPFRSVKELEKFGFKNFNIRKMILSHGLSNKLKKFGLLPPIDLFFGKQIYVFPNFSSWPTLFSQSVPIIYDLSFVLHPEFSEERNRVFLTHQAMLSAKRSTKIITISENSRTEISENYNINKDNIDIVYPIIDSHVFYQRSAEEVLAAKAKYGIFDYYVLFVGNIEPRKNLVNLLKAYEKIDNKYLERYSLLLVGAKGWKDQEINHLISDLIKKGLSVIQPSRWVSDEDMPAVLSGAKAFAYVSKYEGYGMPPVEAMFCGTPVIASDNSSLPEALGGAALMVQADDISSIANALEKVLGQNKVSEELIAKGLKRSKTNDNKPGYNGKIFMDILSEIMKGK